MPFEKQGPPSKRAFNFSLHRNAYKNDAESMEETDTEKHFKKVNTGSWRRSNRVYLSNSIPQKVEVVSNVNKAEQMEKYKRMTELERLRYGEERSKYYY